MPDPDDTLRRELGWTGPEESDFEPDTRPTRRKPPAPPSIPGRPPVNFVPSKPPEKTSDPDDPGATQGVPTDPDAERARSTFREAPPAPPTPPQQQPPPPPPPPPAPPHDGHPAPPHQPPPAQGHPENRPDAWEHHPPGWQLPSQRPPGPGGPPPQHPYGPPPGQPWPAEGGFAPDPNASPGVPPLPTGSYADRIRVNELLPPKRQPPASGWRLFVYRATFGLINPGPSPEDLRQAELEAKIKGALRGHYKVGVMGKGGVGKTTVSASVGSIFAQLRQDDRVVAIDADTSFGKLGSRVDPQAQSSYWELANDKHLDSFADVRSRVGNNAAGLFVLAGEGTPARRRVLDAAIYREATTRLDKHFSISVVDCSSTMDSPVTQEVLRDLDGLIVVSSPWVDGAATAGQTLDWLAAHEMTGLLQRTVVVLNDSDGHADKRTRSILAGQFSGQGQRVIEVPYDGHLRPGGVVDPREMSTATRRKFLEIAAALAEHFPTQDDRRDN
ncbi:MULTISPECIES: MinD/ParA family ATP-binding protein [Mycolicibacterium]|uniref:Chromosome partitioning ATPase n=8 Tax=Mycolicibacterium TaxID=1866885 RepID=A0A378W706_9MYCO|nr:MinD/ParA family protein [Mycolicibacterium senegalense]MCV7336925.1 MinD/ParA family protein [Mycolicibacterium senegalense]MCW1824156.1 MinD/ParA family protein [Mycolicibacterium senegalense]MDR7287568.1 MinD-like ATPase involved in chromosome partitioning or flagellar assembly [Mycolicibacterium senegalense]QZA24609.1 MinD/ParA family protein [Mycolicibacterium senegalense]SUA28855.1 chromosome partitioning ATPase [Mycolicibacterium senegalense]